MCIISFLINSRDKIMTDKYQEQYKKQQEIMKVIKEYEQNDLVELLEEILIQSVDAVDLVMDTLKR